MTFIVRVRLAQVKAPARLGTEPWRCGRAEAAEA